MVKSGNWSGNAQFEGFCIDLLRWVANQVGFNYVIRLVPDHMYGAMDPETKQWNGIVRQLMEKVSLFLNIFLFKIFITFLFIDEWTTT